MHTLRGNTPTVAHVAAAGVALALGALPASALADWPIGTRLDQSVVVDVTTEGFGSLQGVIGGFVPPYIDVPAIAESDSEDCWLVDCYAYSLYVDGMYVDIALDEINLVPASGNVLNLEAEATITLNSPSDPAVLDIWAELAGLDVIDDVCGLSVDPVHVTLSGPIQLSLVHDPQGVDVDGDGTPDTKRMDVVVPPVDWTWDASGDDINFDDCGLADVINTVNEVTGFFGFDIYELVLDQFTPTIDELVTTLPAEIEPLLEDTFSQLTISEELDLLGVPLTFTVWPNALETSSGGLRMELSSVTDVPQHPCVDRFGITKSLATPADLPAIGSAPAALPFTPHAAAMIDDDFVNQVLFGVWSGGLLCYTLPDPTGELELPLPIDSTLLGLLAPEVFDDLVPSGTQMSIITAPTQPPRVAEGGSDVNVALDGLGLGFFVDVDGRRVRLLNIDVAADVGVDLDYDGNTGNLGIGIGLDAGAFTPMVTANEFKPDATAQIEGSFGSLFDTLVGPLLGGALGDMSFAVPGFEGLGITDLATASPGMDDASIGAYVRTGTVPFESAGCDEGGGCDSGCDSGCSTNGSPARLILLVPLVAAGLRRRRYDKGV
jgi:hypothetical protein